MFYINDYVTRKSYNNDVVFKIIDKKDSKVKLKGVKVRLLADCDVSDLKKIEMLREEKDEALPIKKGNYLNGKVLHLDSDEEYLRKSMKLYEKYKVPAVGCRLDEKEMPKKIEKLLEEFSPDILIITGHDFIDKEKGNVNSPYFIECVKKGRIYQKNKDALCIISGACFSSFKELIYQGSNFSSSPGKVSIDVLDPAKVAIMIATTPVIEYVDIEKVINLTSNKEKGMGGIDTKGMARKIY